MNSNDIKNKAKEVVRKYADAVQTALLSDEKAARLELQPGQTLSKPMYHGFYSDERRKAIEPICSDYSKQLYLLAEELQKEVANLMAEAPNEEAMRSISTIQNIQRPSKELLESLMQSYGTNYISYKAIMDVARANEIVLPVTHECDRQNELIQTLLTESKHMNSFEASKVTPGYVEFFGMNIDSL